MADKKRKALSGEVKLLGDEGQFRAVFSVFNVVDHDGDVTLPGAFEDGKAVKIAAWGHNWGALPVGRGVIHADDSKAWVDGEFFLDTAAGLDTYRTVKSLGELQEWSYGFEVLEAHWGQFDGKDVMFLEKLDPFEVSPVLRGAGPVTYTETIKSQAESFDQHADRLIADHRDFLGRAAARIENRAKEGRALSVSNRERLQKHLEELRDLAAELEGLLAAAEPRDEKARALARAEFLTFQRLQAAAVGIHI